MDSGNVMVVLQQLLENHLHSFNRRFDSLESQVKEIHYCVQSLQQDSSETLSILDELQNTVETTKKSLRKTNSFVRRISQNLNRPNDFSGLSHHIKSQYGSTDSNQTHSASRESDDSDQPVPRPRPGRRSPRHPRPPYSPSLKGVNTVKQRRSGAFCNNTDTVQQQDMKRSSMELRQEGSFNNVRNATQDLEDRKAYQLPATTNQHAPQSPQSSTVTNQEATTSQTSPIIHRGVITPQPSGGIQQGAVASIPMESLESFMKYINVEIRDLKLMSALGNIFKDSSSQPQFPLGLYTVLLLDISSSVNKHIFKQVKTFVEQMVDDVENSAADHHLEEMIAILTFGGSCELVQRFTNDYMPVKDALESVHLGGKSPMLFGLAMAMAYCLKFGKKVKVNGHVLNPRIIIFTDGYATDSQEKESCLGADYESNAIRVQSDLFKFLPHLEKAPVTVSCVGVGECNQVFLREITEKCHGEFYPLSTQNAPKLGRYYRYQDPVTRVKNAISQGNSQRNPRDLVHEHTMGSQYIDTDREEILKLLRLDIKDLPVPQPVHRDPQPPTPNIINVISIKPDISNVPVRSPSLENPVPSSPEVDLSDGELFDKYGQPQNRCHPWGARVIRGENWKWPDDQNSPGTVVAHKSEGVLVVKWDCGAHGEYPQENLFKITVPRSLKHEEIIEVGCSVKRGPDWKRGDEDGGPSTVGTVIRKHRDGSVSVVWPFGVVERYRYGERKKELEVIADAPAAAMSAERPSESIEPDTREPNQGETIVWQWIDNETTEQYTLSKDEAAKLEEVYQKKSGTVLVGYKGLQLRCQPTQMKYRDSGGKNRTGQLIRKERVLMSVTKEIG